jgi:hypothetical protein
MNYYGSVATFIRSCGIDHKSLVAREHRPHKEDPDPEAYTENANPYTKFGTAFPTETLTLTPPWL